MTDTETALAHAARDVSLADEVALQARNAWLTLLPEVGEEMRCTNCGHADWRVREIGYERWTFCQLEVVEAENDAIIMIGVTDGWDDMSEGGTHEWLHCWHCDAAHQVPERFEWS